jgi:uncharacterized protein
MLARLLNALRPKDRIFFDHFEASAANVVRMSEDLVAVMVTRPGPQRDAILERLQLIESANDDLTHNIFTDLARNFLTPLDREDIHYLATSLDDIADFILGAGKRLELYKIDQPDDSCRELARLVNEGSKEVAQAVRSLREMHKGNGNHMEFVVRVNSLENEADEVFDKSIMRLFEREKDPIEVIKMRDIYSVLELATDKCEDAANVMESILLKYA